MDVEVSFPEELLIALKQDPNTFRREALLFTLGKLYEQGRISVGLGAGDGDRPMDVLSSPDGEWFLQ